jgi:Flp pilus assembly protein TadG
MQEPISKVPIASSRRRSRAQVMVIMAVAIPILLAATAFGADLAIFYYNWAHLQQAADSAVLAGAAYLPADTSKAADTATEYALLNGAQSSEISAPTFGANNLSMSITLTRQVPYYFGRLLNLISSPVRASATATLVTPGSVTGVVPIGIQYSTSYTLGQSITLKQGGGPSAWGPGNWGALALGGTGASTYSANIQSGYPGTVSLGDTLQTETGSMTGPTQSGFDARISAGLSVDPSGTFSDHSLTDPRAVLVPMVDFTSASGSSEVPVMGFAELWLVSDDSNGDITAYFIRAVVPGVQPAQAGSQYGTYMPVLSR